MRTSAGTGAETLVDMGDEGRRACLIRASVIVTSWSRLREREGEGEGRERGRERRREGRERRKRERGEGRRERIFGS